MLKNKKSRTVLIVIAAILALSVTAFGKTVSENAKLFYNNIKIYIDGAEIVPKDTVGNVFEPFIINGTTYLPVRAISNALGKDVEWDGATQSVYIGKKDQTKPDNYLDRIQYNDYKEADSYNDFTIINGKIIDYSNNEYTNGLLFYTRNQMWRGKIEGDENDSDCIIYYPLNGQYKNLKGKIVLPKKYFVSTWENNEECSSAPADISFYGDEKLIYKANSVTSSMPFSFDIDISGVNQLYVKIKTQMSYPSVAYVALTDLALYK